MEITSGLPRYIFDFVLLFFNVFIPMWLSTRIFQYITAKKYTTISSFFENTLIVISITKSDIGVQAAKDLADRGARVIIGCPNVPKTQLALMRYPRVEVRYLNVCKFRTIREFAARLLNEERSLSFLIHNSAVSAPKVHITEDGFDATHQTHFWGPFLLTELLQPLLMRSAPARIIFTGSMDYMNASFKPHEYERLSRADPEKSMSLRENDANLAVVMWAKGKSEELRLLRAGVTFNLVHPGVGYTLYHLFKRKFRLKTEKLIRALYGSGVVVGDATLLFTLLDPMLNFVSGEFFFHHEITPVWKGLNQMDNRLLLTVARNVLGLTGDLNFN